MPKKQIETADPDQLAALLAENETLRAAQAAQAVQSDQMLDLMVEMREKLDALEAGRSAAPTVQAPQEDAELAALLADPDFKDLPNIQVIEHRLTHGTDAPAAIRLKAQPGGLPEPSVSEDPHGETCFWKLRWFNFTIE